MSDPSAHDVVYRARRTMWAVTVLSVALLTLAGAIIFAAARHADPWSPLGPYPVQRVLEERDNTDTPTVSLAHPVVHVSGTKCADPGEYQINVTVAWQSIDPRGTSIRTGQGTRDAEGGCAHFRFRNDIPPEVIDYMRRQVADGLRPLWRIVGMETPVDDSGPGVPLSWETEPFRVVP